MSKLPLTVAISDYDHVREVLTGAVPVEGAEITPLNLSVEEIFHRFTNFHEWDVSEMSLGKTVSIMSQDDPWLIPIPVFPSRVFRHSAIYVRRDAELTEPRQLVGKRVGIPEWAQTAGMYVRGSLMHQYGIDLASIEWVQAGVNQAGRTEKVELRLPQGIRVRPVQDKTLTQMLLSGEIDAAITAHPPEPYELGDSRIVRLFRNAQAVEEEYWRTTGIFPIMHTVAIRRDVYERHRWVAMNLYKAFDEARRRSIGRLLEVTASRVPIPWMPQYTERWRELFGGTYWPYGVEPNRATLEAFCRFAFEQGVCHRKMAPEELFPREISSTFRV
jgi:4,5-dihydroxyphthalate decarboxylase